MNSARSRGSQSSRYRRVGSGREVDESLFGASPRTRNAGASIVSGATLNTLRDSNATFVSSGDLQRIMQSTRIETNESIRMKQEAQEEERAVKQRVARERKGRMAKKAAAAAARRPMSDVEMQNEAQRIALLDGASKQRDEQMDGVKLLATLGARAAAFTIRDQQLKEMEERRSREKEYDHRMNRVMEIDRLKDLQRREAVEGVKASKRLQDREVLMQQIDERKKQRERETEQVLLEQAAMVRQIEENAEMEEARLQEKAALVKRSIAEVEVFNKRAIAIKEKQLEMERAEDEKVLLWQALRAEKELAREREENEHAAALESQLAKMRAQQEKASDNRSALDELRARRAAEERERKARQREMAEATKRSNDGAMLKQARAQQARAKDQQKAQEILTQKMEYNTILQQAAASQQRETREQDERERLISHHARELNAQIAGNAERRNNGQTDTRSEGREIAMSFAVERAKLERIRTEYVERLEKEGVNPQYLSEMKRCDLAKLQMR
jgi:hypothetical protein